MNAWSAWMLLEGPKVALHTGTDGPGRREDEEDEAVARRPESREDATAAAESAGHRRISTR